jgi:lipopolysaccharide biosynthesis regulator YciM
MAEAVAHPPSLIYASWGLGQVALRQGHLPQAVPRLERAVGLCQEADLPGWFPMMVAALGVAYTLAGRVTDAMPLLTQAMEWTRATDIGVYQTLCSLSLGEAQVLAAWRKRTPSLSVRWRSPVRARNVATRRMPYASWARSQRGTLPQR